jgi:hypothetical protein
MPSVHLGQCWHGVGSLILGHYIEKKKDSLIVQIRKLGPPFVTLKSDYVPGAAAAFLQLFCISTGLCIVDTNTVSEWWNPGVLLVFLDQ